MRRSRSVLAGVAAGLLLALAGPVMDNVRADADADADGGDGGGTRDHVRAKLDGAGSGATLQPFTHKGATGWKTIAD